MRSFHGLASDRQNGIDRAYFEAEHGRVHLALEGLISLHQHYSGDAGITYAEGYIRQEHLGQGLLAGKLYRETFAIDNRHARALGGVTQFAPEEQEYRKWAAIALQRRIEGLDVIRAHLAALDGGNSYTALLVDASQQAAEDNEYGMAAALLEIALTTKELNAIEEVSVRRNRAQHLRELDAKSCLQREAMCETFPAVERLALHAALEEIENALGLNTEYVELWTLKSAYLVDMARFQDAITCADEAITRRPNGYAKPWFNKCNALIQLGRYDDAMECLQRALAQAHAAGSEADVTQTRNMMHAYEGSRREASDEEIAGVFRAIEEGAQRASQEEIERWPWPVNTLENLVRGVIGRAPIAHRETALAYVPLLQKLLEDVVSFRQACVTARLAMEI